MDAGANFNSLLWLGAMPGAVFNDGHRGRRHAFWRKPDVSDATLLLKVEAEKKSGWIAALLNLLVPGAGYVYCGRWFLGIVAFFFVITLFVVSFGYAAVGLVLVLVIDGFLCARRYNRNLIRKVLAEEEAKASANARAAGGS